MKNGYTHSIIRVQRNVPTTCNSKGSSFVFRTLKVSAIIDYLDPTKRTLCNSLEMEKSDQKIMLKMMNNLHH